MPFSFTSRKSLAMLIVALCALFSGLTQAAYFEVAPEVGEWRESFCKSRSENPDIFARCRASGGVPQGNIYNFNCVGGDPAGFQALPVVEQVKRFSLHRYDLCAAPSVRFSGYGHPAHNTYLCWDTVTASRYGVENWSTGNMLMSGGNGASCASPVSVPFSALRTRDVRCPAGSVVRGASAAEQRCYQFCPEGKVLVNGQCDDPPQKQLGCEKGKDNLTDNPCNVATGNKFRSEVDFSANALGFKRAYNSAYLAQSDLGKGWRSGYQKELIFPSADSLVLVSASGRGELWSKVDGVWQGDADSDVLISETLTRETLTGFKLIKANGALEEYDTSGRLLSETDTNGQQQQYQYDSTGKLIEVRNYTGLSLSFAYAAHRLSTVTDPIGAVYRYQYDAKENLTAVVFPDTTPIDNSDNPRKLYHYEDPNYPHHLTGITDENGDRYAHFTYDDSGKVVSSMLAVTSKLAVASNTVGQAAVQLEFQPDDDPSDAFSRTLLSDAIGTEELWSFEEILGVDKLVSKINQTDGKGIQQTWDDRGNLLTHTDAEGRTTSYSYNATNQKTSMTEASGTPQARTTHYEYVSADIDLVTKTTYPSIHSGSTKEVINTYDAELNITAVTINGFDAAGNAVTRTTRFAHDAYGKITQINGPRTEVDDLTTLQYYDCTTGAECGQLKKITNALGHSTSYDRYDAAARLLQSTDANGVVTTHRYHPRGWLLRTTQTPPVGEVRITTYDYDNAGQLRKVTQADGSEQNYVYDAAHELREISDNLGNTITYTYDAKGNRTEENFYDPDGTLIRNTQTTFDHRNFITAINAGGSITQLVNDAVGNLNTQTDPNLNPATAHHFDALDRLSDTVDALSNTTGYRYNIADQLTEVQAANGATTQYQYDDLGNQIQEVSPDRGTLNYTHDAAGNVTKMTDARGITTTYQYDALNRLIALSYPEASENVRYHYDQGKECGAALGRLCETQDASGTHRYQYDAWGNVLQQSWQNEGVTLSVHYRYDAANRITQIRYPSGLVMHYARDALGRVSEVSVPLSRTLGEPSALPLQQSAELIADQFIYRADGLLTSLRLGNDQVAQRDYDLQGRLLTQTLDGTVIANYDYDANGNVVQQTHTDQTRVFDYDGLDRLNEDRLNENRLNEDDWISGRVSAPDWQYEYDASGNRLTQQQDEKTHTLSYHPNSHRLSDIAAQAVRTDNAGNITHLPRDGELFKAGGDLTLTYNQQNHLATLSRNGTLTHYTYNAARQRTIKQQGANQSRYVYDLLGRLIATTDKNGTVHEEYLYANQTDNSPIQSRIYEDTEASTVEAQHAYQHSQSSIKTPDDNLTGQCQAREVTAQQRNATTALTVTTPKADPSPRRPTLPRASRAKKDNSWLVPVLMLLLFDDEETTPQPTAEVHVDSGATLGDTTTKLNWTPITNATDYVIEAATSQTALNQQPDIARHCTQSDTTALVKHLPLNGTNIYIRIWAKVNGEWQYQDYELGTKPRTNKKAQVTRTYFITDHLGTPRFGFNDKKQQTWRWASDGFGNQTPNSDVDGDRKQIHFNFRMPGQYYDAESDLFYNWNRYYDAGMGRYVTSDPIGLAGGLNTFGYVLGNPLFYSDFYGLDVGNPPFRIQPQVRPGNPATRIGGRIRFFGSRGGMLGIGIGIGVGIGDELFPGPIDQLPSDLSPSPVAPVTGTRPASNDICPKDDDCKKRQASLLQEYIWLSDFEDLTSDGLDLALIRQAKIEYNRQARGHNRSCPHHKVPLFLVRDPMR